MFIRLYLNEESITDEQTQGLDNYLGVLSTAGCQVGISDPPDTYVLVRTDDRERRDFPTLAGPFPFRETRALITDVVTLEWGEQPIDPESSELEKSLSALIDLGLPIRSMGWPQLPRQGLYRDKDYVHGVVYLHSQEMESRIRLVVRVEGLTAVATLRFYQDILSGNVHPLAGWDDTCDM